MSVDVIHDTPAERELEAALLGYVLMHEQGPEVDAILSDLQPIDFFGLGGGHSHLFVALRRLHQRGVAITSALLLAELRATGRLEDAGGPAYIGTTLDQSLMSTAAVRDSIDRVRDTSIRRRVTQVCKRMATAAADPAADASTLLAELGQQVFTLGRELDVGEGLVPMSTIVERQRAGLIAAIEGSDVGGLLCGFPSIDATTRGFHPGELIIVAARTSVGKTMFGLNVAENVARAGHSVALFSVEMSEAEVFRRLVSTAAGVDSHRMLSGRLPESQYGQVYAAMEAAAGWSFYVDDSADMSPAIVESRARALKAQGRLDLLIVDYAQLLRGDSRRYDSRTSEVSSVARGLKVMAKRLDVPVIALAQLNREADKLLGDGRGKGKGQQAPAEEPVERVAPPRLSQLGESGELEKAANVVILLHRPSRDSLVIECDIAKSRNGPTRTVELRLEKACMRFHDDVETRYPEPVGVR